VTANAADEEPQALYALGMQSLRARNYARAVEYFDSIEREHPYSTWSTSAKLMRSVISAKPPLPWRPCRK
jgi:outer membrane protein assembly factor BamD